MSENKRCGNCKSFIPSIDGFGACAEPTFIYGVHCNNEACSLFKMKSNNGWAELTPDDVEELYKSKRRVCIAFVCNGEVSYICGQFGMALSTMAKHGGYYYYVLPELKIE